MARPRKAEATSTPISWGDDGYWHAFVYMGDRTSSGKPAPPRHRSVKGCPDCQKAPKAGCKVCFERCAAKVRELEAQRRTGLAAKAGTNFTVAEWLAYWMENIVSDLRPGTQNRGYGWAVSRLTGPGGIGDWRLADLKPETIEAFLKRMLTSGNTRKPGAGLAPNAVMTLYRDLRAALNEAVRLRMGIVRNPCDGVKVPGSDQIDEDGEITPLFVGEVMRILEFCETLRNGSRWTVGLPLGLRQGEALGMPWYVPPKSTREKAIGIDLDGKFAVIGRKAERLPWEHGCDDPEECAKRYCRTAKCKPGWDHGCADPPNCRSRGCWCPERVPGHCKIHRRDCPDVCPPNCRGHAKMCKQRRGGCQVPGCNCSGIAFGPVKTKKGMRRWVLSDRQCEALKRDREAQDKERELAGDLWREHGLTWCNTDGTPVSPERDRRTWKRILKAAGVRDARVHDGRHTAATMLLLQGVDERIVMDLMGWSDRSMLDRYQHVLEEMRADATNRLDTLLYPAAPAQDPAVAQAQLEKAQADVARLETLVALSKAQAELAEAQAEIGRLRAELGSSATDHATVVGGATVLPFPRRYTA